MRFIQSSFFLLLVSYVLLGCSTTLIQTEDTDTGSKQEQQQQQQQCTLLSDDGRTCQIDDDERLQILLRNLRTKKFYINGSWVDPASSDSTLLDVIDPSTASKITQIAAGDQEDVDSAVQAAKNAYPKWKETTPEQRRKFVENILKIYLEEKQNLALLVSREMGAPIDMAKSSQVGAGKYHIQSFLEVFGSFEFIRPLPQLQWDYDPHQASTTILMDPIGLIGMITPWNWPLNQITLKVIPALLVGCTCILKPSEESPLSALLFAQIIHEAGIPPGVFNLINGKGPTVGQQISRHKGVDMVSFTGSTRAGASISKAAADTFKKVSLELGGKGATIVFDDITDEWANEVLESGAYMFSNSGQSCNAGSRLLVQRSLYQQALQIAKEVAESTKVNSAHLHGHHIGPVVSLIQYERIQKFIQSGIDEGATLVAGGLGRPSHLKDSPGYYVRPTVFGDCTSNMTIFQEEMFGPVICITAFDTEEEAIELANDTPYGLTNYVYSRNGKRRRRLAHALRSGMVEMNDAESDTGSPFGGMRHSGVGREGGIYGLEEFCEIKAVTGYFDSDDDLDGDDEDDDSSDDDDDRDDD